jgi:hypothetical protein
MEIETNGSLPFLDDLVTKKPNGSLRQSVYRKPIHAGFYCHTKSDYHPSQKHAVLAVLINCAKTIHVCDAQCLSDEI